jgi:hypothetical protein
MKINLKQLLGFALLAVTSGAQATCSSTSGSCGSATLDVTLSEDYTPTTKDELAYGQTFFSLRPQNSNAAREQMGTAGRVHQFAKQEFHGDISLALEWQQSTNAEELGSWFFFNGTNSMNYGPNRIEGSNSPAVDVNSLNFGTTASGTITAKPRVQNLVADLQLYLGWDEFISGLWTKVGIPINYVRTDMRLEDTVSTAASASLPGEFDVTGSLASVYSDLATAWVGGKAVGLLPVLTNGKIDGRRSETRVAGVSAELGYDFLRREHGHLGLALRAVAPTGNEPNTEYLFDAVSGANNCWEIGGSLNGAYELWSDSDNSSLDFYVNANVTHLGRRAQRRLLGLKNIRSGSTNTSPSASPGASWLTVKKTSAAGVFADLDRAANLLALTVKIGNSVMADAAASLKYSYDNYGVAVGYNFFARSKEEASARESSTFDTNTYVLKDAVAGGSNTSLSTSNSLAANKAETNIVQAGTNVDLSVSGALAANKINDADVDVSPALHPSVRSHKVFGSLEYNWSDNEWEPYLLLGGSYEVGCKASDIKNSAVNQWGVMAKGGIAF